MDFNHNMHTHPPPPLQSRGHDLDPSAARFGFLKDSSAFRGDINAIRARFEEDGYIYLKGFFDPRMIERARRSVFQKLALDGFLDPAHDMMEGVLKPEVTPDDLAGAMETARQSSEVRWVVFGEEICDFYRTFFDEPIRYLDFIWTRLMGRGIGTAPHCDWVYMGRGSRQLMTCWIPYVDISLAMGGLIILEQSHLKRERIEHYLSRDVDSYCENKPEEKQIVEVEGKSVVRGWLSKRPDSLAGKLDSRWLTAEQWNCGDLITFRMDLIHASLDNHTNRLRFSTDTRYQPASHPADERWIGANPPGHSRAGKRGRIC